MKIILKSSVLLLILLTSCNFSNKEGNKLELAKTYYQVLDQSKISEISNLIGDSLVTKEIGYDYEQVFSKKQYIDWLKWDSIFNPTYKILEIEEIDSIVKVKVSKSDQRILFLHKEPTVYYQTLHFEDSIITIIENNNVVFNDSIWVENRAIFLKWIDQNHPELNGFIFDQTEKGGLNYLKAIEYYKNRKDAEKQSRITLRTLRLCGIYY